MHNVNSSNYHVRTFHTYASEWNTVVYTQNTFLLFIVLSHKLSLIQIQSIKLMSVFQIYWWLDALYT